MPSYDYWDPKKKERFTLTMSIAEMTEWEKENPEFERVYDTMNIVDPLGVGVTKPPADFQKYVLGRIKHSVPGATAIDNRRWSIKKEI